MKLDRGQIRNAASRLVALLDREQITSREGLERYAPRTFKADPGKISVEMRPANQFLSLTLSYILPGAGIPVEVKMNHHLPYSQVILKSTELIEGYDRFAQDDFGNIMQNKPLLPGEYAQVRAELERLSRE